jgi:hypothetical protein
MTTIRFIGAYDVTVTSTAYVAAMDCHDDEEYVKKELGSLALVEFEIIGMPSDGAITDMKQPHTEYVPYDESYFDSTTLEQIPHNLYALPKTQAFRVAFYLHFYDPKQPVNTPWGDIAVGPITSLPNHLKKKQYVFWD